MLTDCRANFKITMFSVSCTIPSRDGDYRAMQKQMLRHGSKDGFPLMRGARY